MVKHGADVNARDEDNCSTLYYSVMNGNKDLAEYLLSQGAETNFKENNCGRTPLHMAAIKGYFAIAKMLIDYGSPIEELDNSARIPLYHAGKGGERVS